MSNSERSLLHAITIVIDKYDKAIQHYVEDIGFHLIEDTDLGDGKRWVRLALSKDPQINEATILLAEAKNEKQTAAIGNQTGGRVGFFIHTNSIASFRQRISDATLECEEIRSEKYGQVMVFIDKYGNKWDVIQPK